MLTGGDRSALPRHQTLRATIDWSYDLLEERERALLPRLAIFAGSFDVAAATEICSVAGAVDEWDVLDALAALVDKSLLIAEEGQEERRYRLLQSMREYALERLREAGEEPAVAERHARYYAAFAASLQPLVDALEDDKWRARCVAELDNFRAAIDWALTKGHDRATGIALLAHLEWPEILTAPQEALRWYERAAAERDAVPDALAHARILRHCVLLQWLVGNPLADRQAAAELEVEIAKSSGNVNELSRALANLGTCYRFGGRLDEAEAAFNAAYESPERLSRLTRNAILRTWGVTALQRGDVESARQRFLDVASSERPGSEAHASALLNLAELEYAMGRIDAARDAALEAREVYAALGSALHVLVLSNLAAYALAANDLQDARERLGEALALGRSSRWIVTILEHHALLAALGGDCERAALLMGFTDARYRERGELRQQNEQRAHERLAGLLAQFYEISELDRLTSAGGRLSEEEVLDAAAAISQA